MTPEQLDRLNKLEKEIQDMKRGLNIEVSDGMERLFARRFLNSTGRDGVNDSAIAREITVGAGGGTFGVLDYPDRWIYIYIDGKIHRVGAWLEEFDSSR